MEKLNRLISHHGVTYEASPMEEQIINKINEIIYYINRKEKEKGVEGQRT